MTPNVTTAVKSEDSTDEHTETSDPLGDIEREADCDCEHGVTPDGETCFRCIVLRGVN
jgi:hypothetical protein